jgi:hypothetical protein
VGGVVTGQEGIILLLIFKHNILKCIMIIYVLY